MKGARGLLSASRPLARGVVRRWSIRTAFPCTATWGTKGTWQYPRRSGGYLGTLACVRALHSLDGAGASKKVHASSQHVSLYEPSDREHDRRRVEHAMKDTYRDVLDKHGAIERDAQHVESVSMKKTPCQGAVLDKYRDWMTAGPVPHWTCRESGPDVRWVNVDSMSLIDRLCLEEALHASSRYSYVLVGQHKDCDVQHAVVMGCATRYGDVLDSDAVLSGHPNQGTPNTLPETDTLSSQATPSFLRRFSAGGTVVVDGSQLLVSFIMNGLDRFGCIPLTAAERDERAVLYAAQIMTWTADYVYTPCIQSMVEEKDAVQLSSQQKFASKSKKPSALLLRENDYVVNGKHKVGGSAQSISSTHAFLGRFVHHTCWLTDTLPVQSAMRYLSNPKQQPSYRRQRAHGDFMTTLSDALGGGPYRRHADAAAATERTCAERFREALFRHLQVIFPSMAVHDANSVEMATYQRNYERRTKRYRTSLVDIADVQAFFRDAASSYTLH